MKTIILLFISALLLAACTFFPTAKMSPIPSPVPMTDIPELTTTQTSVLTATSRPLLTYTTMPNLTITPDIWEIQKCSISPSFIIDEWTYEAIWNYVGNIEERGEVDMLLSFTKNNEILGFYFDFEQVSEYKVSGCLDARAFRIWLFQGDTVEAVIHGEFPATDPTGRNWKTVDGKLYGEVMMGSLLEKSNLSSFPLYLSALMGTPGTMEHRFRIAGVEDDTLILNASRKLLAAIANDDRSQVIQMIQFPVEFRKDNKTTTILTPDSFMAQYDEIFDGAFKVRLSKTFPDYMIASTGNFLGTIGLSVYGGGGINFDDHGKVTAIYDWIKPAPTPTPPATAVK